MLLILLALLLPFLFFLFLLVLNFRLFSATSSPDLMPSALHPLEQFVLPNYAMLFLASWPLYMLALQLDHSSLTVFTG